MLVYNKFFVLPDAIPASKAPHIIGTVVEDNLDPLRSYAPIELKPISISPDILPEPVVWKDQDLFVSSTRSKNLHGGLGNLMKLKHDLSSESTFRVNSPEVKSYALVNTKARFLKLMEHKAYADDVTSLIAKSKSGKAYFVTGFVTTAQGTLSQTATHSSKMVANMAAPNLPAVGGVSLIGDASLGPSGGPDRETETRSVRTMTVGQEVIFSMSFDVICRSWHFLTRDIKNGGEFLPIISETRRRHRRSQLDPARWGPAYGSVIKYRRSDFESYVSVSYPEYQTLATSSTISPVDGQSPASGPEPAQGIKARVDGDDEPSIVPASTRGSPDPNTNKTAGSEGDQNAGTSAGQSQNPGPQNDSSSDPPSIMVDESGKMRKKRALSYEDKQMKRIKNEDYHDKETPVELEQHEPEIIDLGELLRSNGAKSFSIMANTKSKETSHYSYFEWLEQSSHDSYWQWLGGP